MFKFSYGVRTGERCGQVFGSDFRLKEMIGIRFRPSIPNVLPECKLREMLVPLDSLQHF